MKDVLGFYRRNPVVGAIVVVLGLLLAVTTLLVGDGSPAAFVLFCVMFGLLVGIAVAISGRR